jgi:hypothetical protein
MALAVTSLAGAITANQTLIRLTAFTNPSVGAIGPKTILLVDGEGMLVTSAVNGPTVQVVRGYKNPFTGEGTTASAHNTLAPVAYGLSTDFTQQIGTGAAVEYSYGADGAVTNPTVDATIYITKATAAALTLSSPNADQTNTVRFVSLTAAAHTLTYTPGFYGNTTSSDVATFPATVGAVFTIVARNGLWNAVATADDGVLLG